MAMYNGIPYLYLYQSISLVYDHMKKVMGLKWSFGHYSSSAGLVFLTFQVRQIWASIPFALFWPTRCQQDITKPTNIPLNWRTRPVNPVNMTYFSSFFKKKWGVFPPFFCEFVVEAETTFVVTALRLRLLQQRHPDLQRTWQPPAGRLSHRHGVGELGS